MNRTYILPLAFVVLALVLSGCSGQKAPGARLSGQLSYNGQPIKAGNLRFHTADGVAYNGTIDLDGTYTATDLPEGELVVTIETEHLNPSKRGTTQTKEASMRMAAMQPPPPGAVTPEEPYIKVPEKYGNPRTSPVTINATRGRQIKDIEFPR